MVKVINANPDAVKLSHRVTLIDKLNDLNARLRAKSVERDTLPANKLSHVI
jgi:hypothetical protein